MQFHMTTEHLTLVIILYLFSCNNASNASWISPTNDWTNEEENSNAETRVDGKFSEVEQIGEISDLNERQRLFNRQLRDNLGSDTFSKINRQKRSTYLIIPIDEASLSKRIQSDYGYGSRLQAGTNVARLSAASRLYGPEGPGKRSVEANDILTENEDEEHKSKRSVSDYGYGSRLSAASDVANSLDKNTLFGIYGPGKRAISTDFGYGSRTHALENVAKTLSRSTLFGLHGPGKRSMVFNDDDTQKRIATDYGYGSRISTAENLAASSTGSGLFGVYGPGKRNVGYGIHSASKRIISDFGYGSREQIAETLAKNADKGRVFGVYGPGKRGGDISPGSGYGSRIGAGSQIAKDITAIYDLFSQHGPGR